MGHGRAALKSDIQLPAHKLPKSEQSHGGFEGSPRRPVMTQLRPMRANKIFQDVFPSGGPTHICQTTSFRAVRCRFQELRVSKTIKTSPTMHDGHLALSGKPGNMPCPTQVQPHSWTEARRICRLSLMPQTILSRRGKKSWSLSSGALVRPPIARKQRSFMTPMCLSSRSQGVQPPALNRRDLTSVSSRDPY